MEATGFVLAGGGSTRMGRDKALLPYRGTTLLEYIASILREAAGTATIIGDPDRYREVGYPVCPDQVPQCGPIGGIYTALRVTASDWNLVVACDMPLLSGPVLRRLIEHSFQSPSNCIVGAGPGGEPQPLCAIYHRRCLPVLEQAIREKRFRMRELLTELNAEPVALDPSALANVNTPGEWLRFEGRPA
jgi:molybdopterin-guanine dinucleotide biosynthesis protein A